MAKCYTPLTQAGHPLVETDLESTEVTKYAVSSLLETKMTFINEIAALCETVGADARAVAHGMGLDLNASRLCFGCVSFGTADSERGWNPFAPGGGSSRCH